MAHALRIAPPTLGSNHRRGSLHAAAAACRHASIPHALDPVPGGPARPPRALRVWPTEGPIDGDDHLALAQDHHQEDASHAGEHPVCLPPPPGAHASPLLPIRVAHRVIRPPGPWPAAAGGRTRAGGVTPQRAQPLPPHASESLAPSTRGHHAEPARGEVCLPAPYAAQCCGGTAPAQRGAPHPDAVPQQRVLAAPAPGDRGPEGCRKPPSITSRLEGRGGVGRLAAVPREALGRWALTAPSGGGVGWGAAGGWGQGDRLGRGWLSGARGASWASRPPRTAGVLLAASGGRQTPARPVPCPHRLVPASWGAGGWAMPLEARRGPALARLQRRGRLPARTRTRQCQLEAEALATLRTADLPCRRPQAEAAQDRQGKARPEAVPPRSVCAAGRPPLRCRVRGPLARCLSGLWRYERTRRAVVRRRWHPTRRACRTAAAERAAPCPVSRPGTPGRPRAGATPPPGGGTPPAHGAGR